MFTAVLPKSRASIMERYDHFHSILKHFQRVIPDTLDRNLYKKAAKTLGLWHNGGIEIGDESELTILTDFAIYGLRNAGGKTPVQSYACAHPPRSDSDDELILNAMCGARYSLLQVTRRVPAVCVEAYDLLRKRMVLVANHGFSLTAEAGMVLATRLISVPGFEISTSADLPVNLETFVALTESLKHAARGLVLNGDTIDDPERMELASVCIIRACLEAGCAGQIVHANPGEYPQEPGLSRALPIEGVSRNRPCPCGSGKKFKRCCGELARL